MGNTSGLLMAVGVILAVLAAGAVWMLAQRAHQTAVALVATRDVPPLTQIEPTDVVLKPLPVQALPRDALRATAQASGRFVRYGLLAGQVVQAADLAATAQGASQFDEQLTAVAATARHPQRMRAVTLSVTPQNGLVLPHAGDRIDLLAVLKQTHQQQAVVLASGIRVLDRVITGGIPQRAGGSINASNNAAQVQQGILVLALTVHQAQQVALAQVMGTLEVALDPLGFDAASLPVPVTAKTWAVPSLQIKTALQEAK